MMIVLHSCLGTPSTKLLARPAIVPSLARIATATATTASTRQRLSIRQYGDEATKSTNKAPKLTDEEAKSSVPPTAGTHTAQYTDSLLEKAVVVGSLPQTKIIVKKKVAKLLCQKSFKWTLTANGQGLEQTFRFKGFNKAWDFMTSVAMKAKAENHHPDWSNTYNTVYVHWTNHEQGGISRKDVRVAQFCSNVAKILGAERQQDALKSPSEPAKKA